MVADLKVRSSVVQKILHTPRHEPETQERESIKEARPAIPTPMLDLAFRDGRIKSFSYAHLKEVDFTPGDTLTLIFADDAKVCITGRNLRRHRSQIRLHRADEICEGTEAEGIAASEDEPHISRIEIMESGQEEGRDFRSHKSIVR